jgi:hypothetical protein
VPRYGCRHDAAIVPPSPPERRTAPSRVRDGSPAPRGEPAVSHGTIEGFAGNSRRKISLLTHVTRIIQKSVFTETARAARAGRLHRIFCCSDTSCAGVFLSRTERHTRVQLDKSERGNPAERLPKLEKQNQPMTPTVMQTVGCRDRRVIVSGLLLTMKIPTTTCGVAAAHRSVRLPAGSECAYFPRQSGGHQAKPD